MTILSESTANGEDNGARAEEVPVEVPATEPVNAEPVDGVPEPVALPDPVEAEPAEAESSDHEQQSDNEDADVEDADVDTDNSDADEQSVQEPSNGSANNDTDERATSGKPTLVQKLVRSMLVETLFVWLIMFDYAVIFPAKVRMTRIKNETVGYIHSVWNNFADNVARFQLLLTHCPEFVMVFVVLFGEILFLLFNIRRTCKWFGRMVYCSKQVLDKLNARQNTDQ